MLVQIGDFRYLNNGEPGQPYRLGWLATNTRCCQPSESLNEWYI